MYPDANTSHSQPDLLLGSDIDLLSSGSLDSFFDDDYEDDKNENLGNLLSCNTLGVENKVCKPRPLIVLALELSKKSRCTILFELLTSAFY